MDEAENSLGHTNRLTAVKRLGASCSKNLHRGVALLYNIDSDLILGKTATMSA